MLSIELKDNHLTLFDNYKNKKLILDNKNKKELLKFTFNSFVEEYRNNLKKYNTTQDKNVDNSFIKMKDLFEELHGLYSEYSLGNVKNMCYLLQNNQNEKEITITMTTCKRIDLFKRTVNSFLECCLDFHLVKEWIVVDDNSSKEDRNEMIKLYPFITFIFKEIKDKGHVKSMNIIKDSVKTKYLFHLEDDWEFLYKDNYLTKCLDVIKIKPQYGQCLINKNYSEGSSCFETVGGELKSYIKNDFKQTFYFEHQHLEYNEQIQMELQKYIYIRNTNTNSFKSQYYWPHFSFRVGLTKVSVLNDIGDFENVSHFEMNYALKYTSKGYITTFLDSIYCSHIGRRTCEMFNKDKPNAYELNNINQFGINSQKQNSEIKKESEKENKKESEKEKNLNDMFKTFVINLKRRPDRLNNFYEKNKHTTSILNINVEEAVDGEKIVLNQKMRRIFHTSDTFFRKGIMGVAFSHMKLWSKLVTDDKYDMYLILEDDVLISNSSEKFLKIIPNEMNNKFPDWDIIYLGNHSKKNLNSNVDKISIEKYTPAQFMENSYGGIFCYLIHKRGAIKLLTNLISNGMNYAIDWDMCMLDCVNNYFMYPFLAFSDMATELPNNKIDSDIQRSHNRFISSAQDWILDDISKMLELTSNKGILYFDRDNWNEFIYEKFDFDVKSNIIVSNELVNKNLLFTNICFTQISYDTTKTIQDLLFKIIKDNIPIYFYTIYERYLVTVPESLYYKYNIKQHFSFINKIDFEYII
jgi:GR25 family glycosyltransferase involved in LPS biosynthesis